MSLILKALKKAEKQRNHSDATYEPINDKYLYVTEEKKSVFSPILIITGIVIICSIFFIFFYRKPSDKRYVNKTPSGSETIVAPLSTIQPAQVAVNVQADTNILADLKKKAIHEIKLKNFYKAEQLLKKAISIKPDDPELYNNLGFVLKSQSRISEAIAQYNKALSLKPNYPEALNNLAMANEMIGNRQVALDLYRKAISQNPSYPEAHLNIGLLLESMGRYQEARDHYNSFLELCRDPILKVKVRERLSTRSS